MTTHELKTWPKMYRDVVNQDKKFEVRKNDRDFKVGDTLSLLEYDPIEREFTGAEHRVFVEYLLEGGEFGIDEGHVVMGIISP